MSGVRATWSRLSGRYAALTRRERLLVAGALVLGPLLIGKALFVDASWARAKGLENDMAAAQVSVGALQLQVGNLEAQLKADPDAAKKAELATLAAEREQADAKLRDLGSTLVPPEKMNELLQGLLARHPGLRLVSLKTLPPQGVLEGREGAKDSAGKVAGRQFDLYRHGVEIRVEGGYAELQAWLEQLEKLPQRLLWERLDYRVLDYPRAEMRLLVHTLSAERTWLTL